MSGTFNVGNRTPNPVLHFLNSNEVNFFQNTKIEFSWLVLTERSVDVYLLEEVREVGVGAVNDVYNSVPGAWGDLRYWCRRRKQLRGVQTLLQFNHAEAARQTFKKTLTHQIKSPFVVIYILVSASADIFGYRYKPFLKLILKVTLLPLKLEGTWGCRLLPRREANRIRIQ